MAQFIGTLIEISLAASVLIGVLLLLSPLLRKKYAPRSLCLIWLVLAVRLLIPFSPHLKHSVITIPAPLTSAAAVPAQVTGVTIPAKTLPAGPQEAAEAAARAVWRPSAAELTVAVWAAGAVSLALTHLLGYYLLRRNIRRYARPYYDAAGLEMFRKLTAELCIPDGRVVLLIYPKTGSPMLTGFHRPAILLPEDGDDISALALILRHELTHYKRNHLWFKLLLVCCKVVHWFNPLVWLMTRDASRQLENVCDREVIGAGDLQMRKEYSETILSAMAHDHTRHLGLSTYYHGGKNTLKQRFTNIFDMSAKKRGNAVIAAVLLAVLFSGALVACGTPVAAGPPSPSASPSAPAVSTSPAAPSASPSEAASPSPSQLNDDAVALVKAWAEAVKNRDGKAQYALYTKDLQKQVYDELNGLNWVTGTSSPWVESYTAMATSADAKVTFKTATSSGPSGSYSVSLTFTQEAGVLKIASTTYTYLISYPTPTAAPTAAPTSAPAKPSAAAPTAVPTATAPTAAPAPTFSFLKSLIGVNKQDLLSAFSGITPEPVDEGGLGFDKIGVRFWFDEKTYTKVTQIIIMTDAIDIDGVKVGDNYKAFTDKFGTPFSDTNGDAHFKYGSVWLSVVRDTATDKVIAVYILAQNF